MNRSVAALLALVSLLMPGIGQALAGAARRALAIVAVALVVQLAFLLAQQMEVPTARLLVPALALLAVGVTAALWVAQDAWRLARAAPAGGWRRRLGVAAVVAAPSMALVAVPWEPVTWRSFSTPSGSMIPTLMIGDRFIAQEGWYAGHPVRRGEVVVFTLPGGTAYVKRVLGLPGDTVQMVRGRPVLNGTLVPVVPAAPIDLGGTSLPREIWSLPDGPRVTVARLPGMRYGTETAAFAVPQGHVFVIGDNVDNSMDSRLDPRMQAVPLDALVGRAAIIYWPWTGGRFGREVR